MSLLVGPKFMGFDANGDPLSGGKLYTYAAGTTTAKVAYTDPTLLVAHANPIILDSRGEALVYFNGTYKLILTTSADVAVWTVDNVEGSGSVNVTKLSSYADLVTAVSVIGATESTLYMDKDDTMSANVIIPTTMQLHFLKGNMISTTGYTLTFSGSPENIIAQPNQQIFSGTGTVSFVKDGTGYPGWWGAVGDGSTDDQAAFNACVTACGRTVIPGDGTYKVATAISLPNAYREIVGEGNPILTTAGTNDIIYQANEVGCLIEGIKFTGGGKGIHFSQDKTVDIYRGTAIQDCHFENDTTIYGIYLEGAKNLEISRCFFKTCNGIYATTSQAWWVTNCYFHDCAIAIFADGQDDNYSTGPYIINSEILGNTIGVKVSRCDDMLIDGCVIDYNDSSIQLYGQYDGKIVNSYLGTRIVPGNPAIYMVTDVDPCWEILIANNMITVHSADYAEPIADTYDAIVMSGTIATTIKDNIIHFYTRYGVSYSGDTNLRIQGNRFDPLVGHGVYPVYDSGAGDTANYIVLNSFTTQNPSITSARFFGNIGYVTEANGVDTITNPATTKVVTHGMDITPNIIMLTPQNDGNATKWWTSNITATEFTINVNSSPAATQNFYWEAFHTIKSLR